MNKRIAGAVSVALIVICIAYIIYDIATGKSDQVYTPADQSSIQQIETNWSVDIETEIVFGDLISLTVTSDDNIVCGGENFIAGLDKNLTPSWNAGLSPNR